MRKIIFIIILIHGVIHLMGFVKAFELAEISELSLPISRGWGLLWLAAALSFVAAGVLWLLQMEAWWFAAMPLVLLHDFYFVRRYDTNLSVKIGDRYYKPDTFPMPLDFSRIYFARYSPDPLIAMLNPAFEGVLDPLIKPIDNMTTSGDTSYELSLNGPIYEIQGFSRAFKSREFRVNFSPAFPNVGAFEEGAEASGMFEIAGDPSTGLVRAEYSVRNINGVISIELIPSGGWIPNEPKLTLRFLYRVVPMFKEWPTTYRWTANLQRTSEDRFMMKSSWERIQK